MYWSKYFIPTLKEIPLRTEALSHQLSLRAGLVHMLTSGVYSYLPLGLKVLKKIESIIREEVEAAGARELFLPCLQPLELWKKTGRDQVMDEVMIKFKDNRGKEMCLGPTHEEVITDLVKDFIQSYKQLPLVLYQIQTKFRDEIRTRFGIVRACEFIMKDAYSFDKDKSGLEKNYKLMYQAYNNIFKRCGLDVVIVEADSGAMGGDISHEYMVPAPIGEDVIVSCLNCDYKGGFNEETEKDPTCPQCKKSKLKKSVAIELGHIFQLGTKYSQAQEANFLDDDGKLKPLIMGCYGIGVSRVIAAILETNNDEKGIVWPREVAPFDIEIIPLQKGDGNQEVSTFTEELYKNLISKGYEVLVDDRAETPGRKFNDADLIGMPLQIVLGERDLTKGKVEIKVRKGQKKELVEKENLIEAAEAILNNGK